MAPKPLNTGRIFRLTSWFDGGGVRMNSQHEEESPPLTNIEEVDRAGWITVLDLADGEVRATHRCEEEEEEHEPDQRHNGVQPDRTPTPTSSPSEDQDGQRYGKEHGGDQQVRNDEAARAGERASVSEADITRIYSKGAIEAVIGEIQEGVEHDCSDCE